MINGDIEVRDAVRTVKPVRSIKLIKLQHVPRPHRFGLTA
jgi:hypothetical protein